MSSIVTPHNPSILNNFPIVIEPLVYRHLDSLHWHEYAQVWYVVSGEMRHNIDGTVYTQKAGDCIVVLPYNNHAIDSRKSSENAVIVSISYADEYLAEHGYDIFSSSREYSRFEGCSIPTQISLCGEAREQANAFIKAMLDEFWLHEKMSLEKTLSHFADFFRLICTKSAKTPPNLSRLIERTRIINDIIHYMDTHLNEKLSLDLLCNRAYMSRGTFTKTFKDVTGITSKDFILSSRLSKASTLLIFTDKKLDEIADDVGFYDNSYLTRSFRKMYGMSPMQYRDSLRPRELDRDKIFRSKWSWLYGDEK